MHPTAASTQTGTCDHACKCDHASGKCDRTPGQCDSLWLQLAPWVAPLPVVQQDVDARSSTLGRIGRVVVNQKPRTDGPAAAGVDACMHDT